MTLPLQLGAIKDPDIRHALELIAQEFPLHANTTDFAQLPGAVISATANQALTNNTITKATFDTTVWANPGITVDLTNERLTVLVAGKYHVWGQATVAKDLSTRAIAVRAHIRKNSAEHQDMPAQGSHSPNTVGGNIDCNPNGIVNLAVNDTLELWAFQVNDGAVNENLLGTTADSTRTKLGCHWLGP